MRAFALVIAIGLTITACVAVAEDEASPTIASTTSTTSTTAPAVVASTVTTTSTTRAVSPTATQPLLQDRDTPDVAEWLVASRERDGGVFDELTHADYDAMMWSAASAWCNAETSRRPSIRRSQDAALSAVGAARFGLEERLILLEVHARGLDAVCPSITNRYSDTEMTADWHRLESELGAIEAAWCAEIAWAQSASLDWSPEEFGSFVKGAIESESIAAPDLPAATVAEAAEQLASAVCDPPDYASDAAAWLQAQLAE